MASQTYGIIRFLHTIETEFPRQPYLSLAGMLGVGAEGVKENAKLKSGNCLATSAAELGEEGRKALGITERMSLTWEEARRAFEADDVIRKVLGSELVKKYLDVNKVSPRPDD